MGFCDPITPTCDTCYETIYGQCNDVLTLSLGLTAATTYYLNLIDKFDNITQVTVTTDSEGDFTITQTWSEFNGDVEIEIYSDSGRTAKVSFTISSVAYDCVIAGKEGICSNSLNFEQACNSQYLVM